MLLTSMRDTREWLRARWEHAGLEVAPGAANFLLVRTGDALHTGEMLLTDRIVVRDASSFGLSEWIRIAVPPPAARDRVAAAVIAASRLATEGR